MDEILDHLDKAKKKPVKFEPKQEVRKLESKIL